MNSYSGYFPIQNLLFINFYHEVKGLNLGTTVNNPLTPVSVVTRNLSL